MSRNLLGLTDPEMGRLPRHQFKPSGARCGNREHHIVCLCDVPLTDEPTPVRADMPLMFAGYALKAIGASEVSASNFFEWAEYMLGAYDKWRTLPTPVVNMDDPEGEPMWLYPDGSERPNWMRLASGATPWSQLPQSVQDRLCEAYKVRLPWEAGKLALPQWVSPQDEAYIRRHYTQQMCRFKPTPTVPDRVQEMEMAA